MLKEGEFVVHNSKNLKITIIPAPGTLSGYNSLMDAAKEETVSQLNSRVYWYIYDDNLYHLWLSLVLLFRERTGQHLFFLI